MKNWIYVGLLAGALSLPLAAGASVAATPVDTCKAGVAEETFEGVAPEEMAAACECMADKAAGNAALEAEIVKLSPMKMADRLAVISPELQPIAAECFPPASLEQ